MNLSIDFPYRITLPKDNWREQVVWCTEKFGINHDLDNLDGVWMMLWAGRKNAISYTWHFKNELDATMFILKWS